MSSFLTFDQVALDTPEGSRLFSDLTFSVGREIVGVVGRNGAGKSTLLRAIAERLPPAAGSVTVSGRVGVLRQNAIAPGETVAEALGIAGDLAVLDRIEQGLMQPGDLDAADWLLAARIEAAFETVGLTADLARPANTLSGGERMRLALARVVMAEPDLLLLDEPTNDLDAAGRGLIAEFLAHWRGGALVASHDRALLENVDRIVELSLVGTTVFGGGWSAFAAARDAERERAAAAVEQAQARAEATRRAVQASRERQERRQSSGRSFAKSGSVPRIAAGLSKRRAEVTAGMIASQGSRAIEEADDEAHEARRGIARITPVSIELAPTGLPANRTVLSLTDVVLESGGRQLFGPLSFTLRGPERIALAGANGAGKSSLMRLIIGELEPNSGRVELNVPAAYLDQHVRIVRDDLSLLENLSRIRPALSEQDARAALARFGFRNRDALRPATTLSGGERLRAGLACAMSGSRPIQLLLLDEPTNHLDIESVATLERALRAYDGALLVVSHDPAFLDTIGVCRTIWLGES